jgi:hypothetical protein
MNMNRQRIITNMQRKHLRPLRRAQQHPALGKDQNLRVEVRYRPKAVEEAVHLMVVGVVAHFQVAEAHIPEKAVRNHQCQWGSMWRTRRGKRVKLTVYAAYCIWAW